MTAIIYSWLAARSDFALHFGCCYFLTSFTSQWVSLRELWLPTDVWGGQGDWQDLLRARLSVG